MTIAAADHTVPCQFNTPPDLEDSTVKQFIEHICLMLEREVKPNELLSAWRIDEQTLKTFLSNKSVQNAVSIRCFEMKNDGTLARVAALRALTNNRDRLGKFLKSDLSANAHVTISQFAYKMAGLEAKDKKAEQQDPADVFKVTINLAEDGARTKIQPCGGPVTILIPDEDAQNAAKR